MPLIKNDTQILSYAIRYLLGASRMAPEEFDSFTFQLKGNLKSLTSYELKMLAMECRRFMRSIRYDGDHREIRRIVEVGREKAIGIEMLLASELQCRGELS